jgi:hypothetical protein
VKVTLASDVVNKLKARKRRAATKAKKAFQMNLCGSTALIKPISAVALLTASMFWRARAASRGVEAYIDPILNLRLCRRQARG